MKFTILIVAVALVAGVTGSPCQAPPQPPKCTLPKPAPVTDGPIKTGVVGTVGFDVLGNIVNEIGIAGEDMKESKNPIIQLVGHLAVPVSDVGLLVTDEVVGAAAGDLVSYVAKAVRDAGFQLEKAGPVGAILASLLKPAANVVESLGGDELPK